MEGFFDIVFCGAFLHAEYFVIIFFHCSYIYTIFRGREKEALKVRKNVAWK
jgi:hypothetical protein